MVASYLIIQSMTKWSEGTSHLWGDSQIKYGKENTPVRNFIVNLLGDH